METRVFVRNCLAGTGHNTIQIKRRGKCSFGNLETYFLLDLVPVRHHRGFDMWSTQNLEPEVLHHEESHRSETASNALG